MSLISAYSVHTQLWNYCVGWHLQALVILKQTILTAGFCCAGFYPAPVFWDRSSHCPPYLYQISVHTHFEQLSIHFLHAPYLHDARYSRTVGFVLSHFNKSYQPPTRVLFVKHRLVLFLYSIVTFHLLFLVFPGLHSKTMFPSGVRVFNNIRG